MEKGVYPYGYMYDWEKFNETSLPKTKMQITDADYTHAKRICKDFEIKDLGEYHDLHVQCNALWGSEFLSYENELRKMTSHFELLTRNFLHKFIFRVTNSTS